MKGAPEAKQLDNVLRPLGFRRRGRTWNREGEEFVDVVDVQIASWDEYTVNAGVMWRAIEDVVWGLRGDGIVVEPSCTVWARIGMLAGDRRDRWWPLGDPTATAEVSDRLQSDVLPFLEAMHSLEAVEDRLVRHPTLQNYPPDRMRIAVIRYRRGEQEMACDLLRTMSVRNDAWSARVRDAAVRLGCDSANARRR